ncbi:TPA: hypothetical protein N0F65_002431, partial [Lagenidium giganteum]
PERADERRVRDEKAFAIIAQGVEVDHQSKIRHATSTKQAWDLLRDHYNRSNLQNRITLTRKLHEFKMDTGSRMASHLDRFGELVVSMEAVGDPLDQQRQMVILLGSLPTEYETIVTVTENTKDVTLDEVKENLLKQFEKHQTSESTEGAFKARQRSKQHGKPKQPKTTCAFCKIPGHPEQECTKKKKKQQQQGDETLFMAHTSREHICGWLVDSGASSHMTPHRQDFCEYEHLQRPIIVTIADGKTMPAIGRVGRSR